MCLKRTKISKKEAGVDHFLFKNTKISFANVPTYHLCYVPEIGFRLLTCWSIIFTIGITCWNISCELMFCCYALGRYTTIKTNICENISWQLHKAIKFVTMQFSAKKGLWPNQETLNDKKIMILWRTDIKSALSTMLTFLRLSTGLDVKRWHLLRRSQTPLEARQIFFTLISASNSQPLDYL